MSRKSQTFQKVSAAIDLDSSGLHEAAFTKYLECIQSLSSFLVEESNTHGYPADENQKKVLKQVLSVIRDCAERASSILISESTDNFQISDNVRPTAPSPPPPYEEKIAIYENYKDGLLKFGEGHSVGNAASLPSSTRYRSPAYIKMEKDNAMLMKKYQSTMDHAKDEKARQNLALELQRGITENLVIARNKHAEILKKQREGRKAALEMRIQSLMNNETCLNQKDQEKKDLYIEILRYEAKQSQLKDENYISPEMHPHEVAGIIFHQTLKSATHPLTQWLIIEQGKLQKQLLDLMKDFSHYIPVLPEPIPEYCDLQSIVVYPANRDVRIWELQRSLEDLTQSIRSIVESAIEIIYTAYKDHLSEEAETLAYRLTESLLILPLWPLVVVLVRITNLESELRIAETMLDCKKYSQQFALSCNISYSQFGICSHSICEVKKIPTLLSLCDKLSVLVSVCQSLCEAPLPPPHLLDNQKEKKFGADDLVPVLSYVCAMSGIPHIVSECRALDLLIHPRYMLGEEGYAVTSFQAALNYLEMKKLINPFVPDNASTAQSDSTSNVPGAAGNSVC